MLILYITCIFSQVDTGAAKLHAFIGEKKKSYQIWTSHDFTSVFDLTIKTAKKGVEKEAAKKIEARKILDLLVHPGFISATFNRLQSKNHVISMVTNTKRATSSFDNSGYYKDCGYCNVPFFTDVVNIGRCTSPYCRRFTLMSGIWRRVLHEQ